jgi:hypothetical protein
MPDERESEPSNEEVASAVQQVTGAEPVNGEDLLADPELKRQLREAKAGEKQASGSN